MTVNDPVAESSVGDAAPSRRELAVARSLDPARARAEKRVQRFLDAVVEHHQLGQQHPHVTLACAAVGQQARDQPWHHQRGGGSAGGGAPRGHLGPG